MQSDMMSIKSLAFSDRGTRLGKYFHRPHHVYITADIGEVNIVQSVRTILPLVYSNCNQIDKRTPLIFPECVNLTDGSVIHAPEEKCLRYYVRQRLCRSSVEDD